MKHLATTNGRITEKSCGVFEKSLLSSANNYSLLGDKVPCLLLSLGKHMEIE